MLAAPAQFHSLHNKMAEKLFINSSEELNLIEWATKQLKMLMFTHRVSGNISSILWCSRLQNASVLISVSIYNCSHRHNNNLNTPSCTWKSLCAMSPCTPLIHIQSTSGDPLCTVTTATAWCFMCFFPACQLSILRLLTCYVSVHFIKQTEMRQNERGVVSLFPFATSLIWCSSVF